MARPEDLLDFGKRLVLQFEPHEFAAAAGEAAECGPQPVEHFLAFQAVGGIGRQIGQRQVRNRHLRILAMAHVLAPQAQRLIAQNLKGQRHQVFQAVEVGVFFVQQNEHLLRQVFGDIPRY